MKAANKGSTLSLNKLAATNPKSTAATLETSRNMPRQTPTTMLMKNSILEEIQKDYMRTALAKGSSYKRAVWKHAFRNSLIPLATRMSQIFTLMFAGALLIEKVFDIDGMGLLVFNSIVSRDYNVVMGIILLTSILTMLGRLFSDILYAVVDPRITLK